MLQDFRSDKNYFANYHLKVALVFFGINLILGWWQTPTLESVLWYLPALYLATSTDIRFVIASFVYAACVSLISSEFTPIALLGLPLAIVLTFTFSSLIHCASHESIRPRFLNRPIGELMGVIQMSGFVDWKIVHIFHHKDADDPEWDPHPPLKKSYWAFAKSMRDSILNVYVKYYFKFFGQNEESMKALKRFALTAKFNMWMKATFWFLLLKPQYFTFFFLASVAFKMLHWAWFNYSTHRPADEKIEIRNLTGHWYKVANLFGFGLYYHDNHHASPQLFNPRYKDTEHKGPRSAKAA